MIKVDMIDITPLENEELFQKIYESLPTDRREKADLIKYKQSRLQSVAAGWLREKLIKEFRRTPYFTNISHSGRFAACIIGDVRVGIDIQKLEGVRESVVKRCYCEAEKKELSLANNQHDKDKIFTQIWTVKEARAKLSGKGLAEIIGGCVKEKKGNEKNNTDTIHTKSFFIEYENEEYFLTIAIEGEEELPEYNMLKKFSL